MKRYLIVNADDFGLSFGVNRGIIEAFEHGIVTSTSLMVNWIGTPEAAAYARRHPKLSLGLHLDLGEWAYRNGEWVALYEEVPLNDARAVADEVNRQLASFRFFIGKDPSHIDSHQHVHREEPLQSIVTRIAQKLSIPLRHFNSRIGYCGNFYGQTTEGEPFTEAISVDGLIKILETLPPGITELCCHPGHGDDLDTMYRTERAIEVQTLCDPRVRASLERLGIELCSFNTLGSVKW
jgi:chitin disaccharide deacetylase